MRINKLLVVSTLALPAAITPLGLMTSCSNTWGHKTPLATGSIEKDNSNNPYYAFNGSIDLYDLDGVSIPSYLQSNYILDQATNLNYAYSTPVETWYKTENKITRKLPQNEWVDGSSVWATPSTSFSTSITENEKEVGGKKYNITQTCSKNVTLSANISFVNTISQFINKYVGYAINYATSQVHNADDFKVAWGGTIPTSSDYDTKRALYEWMFANSNAHATTPTDSLLKTTNVNFNFAAETFPIPAYNEAKDEKGLAVISPVTSRLLSGQDDPTKLGKNAPENQRYYSNSTSSGSGDDKYTIYTYPAVPVIISTSNLTQRFINPTVNNDTIFINNFYQNDKAKIVKAVDNSWSAMSNLFTEEEKQGKQNFTQPTIYKYDIKAQNGIKEISFSETNTDKRLFNLAKSGHIYGSDFIAFITYNYVEWDKPNAELNRHNTVTLSSLQTIMPAYLLNIKTDLWKQSQTNGAYITDVNKADKYSTELINLLGRNSDQGRIAKASNLNKESKEYLLFLSYMFGKEDGTIPFDFVDVTKFA